MKFEPWPISRYERISQAFGVLVVLISGAALVGWFLGSVTLKGIGAGYIPMAPNTALVFLLLGGILAISSNRSTRFQYVPRLAVALAMAMVVARMSEYLTAIELSVDHWIFRFPAEQMGLAPVGKMAFFTAMTFLLLGAAFFLLTLSKHRVANNAGQGLSVVVAFIGLTFSLGYLYGAPLMYGGRSIPMALNTAICFCLCGAGLLVKASIRDISERRMARAALQQAHDELEARVKERTAELRAQQHALLESEERTRLVIDTALDAVITIDTEGRITSWNAQSERIFGWSPVEAIGLNLTETIIPTAYREAHLHGMRRFFATGESRVSNRRIEISAVNREGKEFPVELAIARVERDGVCSFSAFVRDISERKQAEMEIKGLNESLERRVHERTSQLESANKELEAFSYSVSHDLRAPLRAIDGFSRILVEDNSNKLDADAIRLLDVIRSNTRRMGRLIDDLLDLSRLGRKSIEQSHIDMHDLAQDVVTQIDGIGSPAFPRIELLGLPPAQGDAALIRQVFVNLISNAAKYSRGNKAPLIQVGGHSESGENVYYVKDNGVGFDMRYADKLFGVFQRLHSAEEFEGTGVGLAIVQRIIHRHGGRVWAEARVNEGATFYFTLPKKDETNGNLDNANKGVLLLAENNPTDAAHYGVANRKESYV